MAIVSMNVDGQGRVTGTLHASMQDNVMETVVPKFLNKYTLQGVQDLAISRNVIYMILTWTN